MSNDQNTNDFVRQCVLRAARFYNMEPERHDAAATLINVARMAIESPQETAPIHHYVGNLRAALEAAYGYVWELAELPNTKQEEAVVAWMWFVDVTGADPDSGTTATTISDAVAEMRIGGDGWRSRMRDALRRDFNREQFGTDQLKD